MELNKADFCEYHRIVPSCQHALRVRWDKTILILYVHFQFPIVLLWKNPQKILKQQEQFLLA